jgi:hypothetical protein
LAALSGSTLSSITPYNRERRRIEMHLASLKKQK